MRVVRMLFVLAPLAATVGLAAPALAGGGVGGESAACPAFTPDQRDDVAMWDFCFAPIGAVATAGGTLTVRNEGEQPHTFTAVDGSFDTGVVAAGGSATVAVPDEASGLVPVYCTLHADRSGNGMAGTLTVLTASADASAATGGQLGSSGFALAAGVVLGVGGVGLLRRAGGATAAVREDDVEA